MPLTCDDLEGWEWGCIYTHLYIHIYTHTHIYITHIYTYQFSSVTQLYLTLCHPMEFSTPGFPVHYQIPELVQTHIHQVGDVIQPSHSLSPPSPPAVNLSQHQGLFQ